MGCAWEGLRLSPRAAYHELNRRGREAIFREGGDRLRFLTAFGLWVVKVDAS